MIVTGIFLLLLGTAVDKTSAVKADIKYEESKITIKEQIDQSHIMIPGQGPPNYVHQGSNYFFGAPFSRPAEVLPLPPPPGRVEVLEEEIILSKPIGTGIPTITNPMVSVKGKEVIKYPKLPLPLPNVSLNMPPGAFIPSYAIPFMNPELLSQLPILSQAPYLSQLIESTLGVVPLPPAPGRIEVIEEEILLSKPHIETRIPTITNSMITVNEKEVFKYPKLPLPLPNASLNIPPGAFIPSYAIPFINPELLSQLPFSAQAPYLSHLVESTSGFVPLPSAPGRIEVVEEEILMPKPLIETGIPTLTNSIVTVNGKEVIKYPKLPLPTPNVSLSMPPGTFIPSYAIPFINPELLSQLPISAQAPYLSHLIERPVHLSNDVVVSEMDILFEEIPPPPQLQPLNLEEIFQSFIVEEKSVVLVPSPPEIEAVLPPSIVLAGQPCLPSLCARKIVFERVLPNIACRNSKPVELISIPASLRDPVVTTSFLPYILKK